jgi:prepilin-type N-terminal cleavage/methylation domain-containing protein
MFKHIPALLFLGIPSFVPAQSNPSVPSTPVPEASQAPATPVSGGFSLIEVLVSVVVLSVATLGIVSVWRLADEKALAARLDERATRILAEYSELQNFAPQYLFGQSISAPGADFEGQGIPLNSGETRTGFLYHPRHIEPTGLKSSEALFDDAIPYQLTLLVDDQGQLVRLTYQLPYLSSANAKVVKQIRLNPR